jgi:hypothetical protein
MGPRGVGAASRRMGASERMASVFVVAALLGSGCAPIEQPVSGPVALTDQWVTVSPPEPLRIARNEQTFCLQIDTVRDIDLQDGVMLGNGQRHVLGGAAIDDEGTQYPLKVGALRGDTVCLYRAGKRPPDSDFPADRSIAELRLRSQPPLQVREIRWFAYNRH